MEIRCSFGLGFVQRSHKPMNCWGYESKTPIGVKETWNHQNYMMFRRIGGPLVKFKRVLGFLPKVLRYEVPNHQFLCYGVVFR